MSRQCLRPFAVRYRDKREGCVPRRRHKLAEGEVWRQESIIGSVFEASYPRSGELSGQAVISTITGHAHIMAEGRLCFDSTDPFAWGIPVA